MRSPPPRARRRPWPGRREPRAAFRPRQLGRAMSSPYLLIADEVRAALEGGRAGRRAGVEPHRPGAPAPHNLQTAPAAEAAVRESGAVPATTAARGRPAGRRCGSPNCSSGSPTRSVTSPRRARATSVRCWRAARWRRPPSAPRSASRTWRASSVFATGGIGGVHRGAAGSFDVSSDIDELAATPVAVVCSGAKSILDLPATLEMLETRRVPVVGLGVDEMPGFYSIGSGPAARTPGRQRAEAAAAIRAHRALPGAGGIVIVQPPPAELALDAAEVEGWIADGLPTRRRGARRRGRHATPARRSWHAHRAAARWR